MRKTKEKHSERQKKDKDRAKELTEGEKDIMKTKEREDTIMIWRNSKWINWKKERQNHKNKEGAKFVLW